jgi:hypothetical protein
MQVQEFLIGRKALVYTNLWKTDDTRLVKIIMMAMQKESKEDCLTPPIISFSPAVCCIVLNSNSNVL